ncbi:MAG: hypothetical protein FWE31_02300 [Firmicutes bacterium]|nr:hypothetical protein [Bacillota bacterium]
MKFLKYVFAVTLLVAFMLITVGFSPVNREGSHNHASKEIGEYDLLSEVMSRYMVAESGYNDHFAGVWYDVNGTLNIAVTNNTSRESRNSEVIYHAHQFSFNFLSDIHNIVMDLMYVYSISATSIAPQYNFVEIYVEESIDIRNVTRHLSALGLFQQDAIRFVIEENAAVLASTPIRGGHQISGGTMGAKAICMETGRRGIITNSHVAPHGWMMRHEPTQIMIGRSAQYQMERGVDAAFVPFEDADIWEFDSSASFWAGNRSNVTVVPRTYQIRNRNDIVVGLPVVKFGDRTGRTEGTIERIRYARNVEGIRFTDQIRHSARMYFGDSGSPLFTIRGGRYYLAGLNFGFYRTRAGNWVRSYANKITNVTSALGVKIMTESMLPDQWFQPRWTADSNIHGAITASGYNSSDTPPFNAFDRDSSTQWTKRASSGWLQLTLTEEVIVYRIEFYNRYSGTGTRTRDAYFTGANGVPLGNPFRAESTHHFPSVIEVNNVRTNVIRLNITSSSGYFLIGNFIGSRGIVIHARTITPITTAHELDTLVRGNPYGHFRLANTIDLRDLGGNWAPIPMFRGTLDGGWHHIRGLTIVNPIIPHNNARFGLFERNYGTIRNFRMTAVDIRIDNRSESHWANVGSVAGLNGGSGRIENVFVTGVLHSYRRNSSLGGVVGDNHGTMIGNRFIHYVSRAAIYGNGDMGGIAGRSFNGGVIHHSRVYRAGINHAHATSNRAVGGLVGYSRATCLVGNFLDHLTVAYTGVTTSCNKAPMMGMKVGFFNGQLINMATSDHNPSTVHLNPGTLHGQQLRNFGTTSYWQWAGTWAGRTVGNWNQPVWSSPTLAGHGMVTASGTYRNEHPWRAFNGTMNGGSGGNGDNWSVNAQTGYLELRLNYFIIIHSIELWGNTSGGNNRTRGAHFTTGLNGAPLGTPFELANQNHAHRFVQVGEVRTNVIRLNITSSYGHWVGASLIRIHATR